jgi:hypothetical protein
MLRCRSIASLQRTVSTPPLVDFRAPRIWIFLSSLQEAFFSTFLAQTRALKNLRGKSPAFSVVLSPIFFFYRSSPRARFIVKQTGYD